MATISGFPLGRFQAAAKFWDDVRNGLDVDLERHVQFDVLAVGLTEGYLREKNIEKIDLNDQEHRRYLEIAMKIHDGVQFDNPEDARIALKMKDIRCVSYENVAAPLRDCVQTVIPIVDGVAVTQGTGFKLGWLYTRLGLNEVLKARDPITLQEVQSAFPDGISLEKAQELLGMNLADKAKDFVLQNVIADLRAQKSRASGLKESLEVAEQLTKQCAHIVLTYYHLSALNREYERERRNLCKQFDQICEGLKLGVTIETFKGQNPDEIVRFFQSQRTADTFGEQAKMILEISEKIYDGSSKLIEDIEHGMKNKEFYERKGEKLQRINREIKGFYNNEIKDLNEATKILGYIKHAGAFCNLVGKALSFPFREAASLMGLVVEEGAGIGREYIDGKRKSLLAKLDQSLETSESGAQMLGYLSQKNLAELLALKQSKRDELDCLLTNRNHIKPSTYRALLSDLDSWLALDKADQEKELKKQEEQEKELSEAIVKEQGKQCSDKKSREEKQSSVQLKKLKQKEAAEAIAKLKEGIGRTKELIEKLEKEKALAEYVSPITNRLEELMEIQAERLSDEKTERWNEELDRLFKALKSVREEGYRQRQAVYDSFIPMVNGLQFFAQELDWLKDSNAGWVLRNSPEFLKLARDCDAFGLHISAVKDFKENFQGAIEGGKLKNIALPEKVGSSLILENLVCPLIGAVGLAVNIAATLYRIARPASNPVIEAVGKMFEKGMGYQAELLKEHLKILTEQNEDLSQQIRDSANKIIVNIRGGADLTIDHLNRDKFTNFEFEVNKIKNKIELKVDFRKFAKQLSTYLAQSKDPLLNGFEEAIGYEHSLIRIVNHPAYYAGFLLTKRGDLASLHIFKALLTKALEARSSQTEWGSEESRSLIGFIDLALKEIEKYQQLMVFPEGQLKCALESKRELLRAIGGGATVTKGEQRGKVEKVAHLLESHRKILSDPLGWNKFYLAHSVHGRVYHVVVNIIKEEDDWDQGPSRTVERSKTDGFTLRDVAFPKRIPRPATDSDFYFSFFSQISANFPDGYGNVSNKVVTDHYSREICQQEIVTVGTGANKKRAWIVTPEKIRGVTEYVTEAVLNKTKSVSQKVFLSFSVVARASVDFYELSVEKNSYMSLRDIRSVATMYPNEAVYSGKIREMVNAFLHMLKKPDLTKDQVLASRNEKFVPLVFPRKLLAESLKERLESEIYKFESLQVGTLVPSSYDFSYVEESEKFELSIQFSVEYRDSQAKQKHYCDFVIAEFDKNTVDSFRACKSMSCEKKWLGLIKYQERAAFDFVTDPYYNEFLIQAMYCGQHGLGLPGEGTYRTESGELVAPVERAFPGLYPLFSAFPSAMKSYDSAKNKEKPLCTSEDLKPNVDVLKYKEDPDFSAYPFRLRYNRENYIAQQNEILVSSSDLRETVQYKKYLRDYQLFQALYRLNNECDENVLVEAMAENLGLIPPEALEMLRAESELHSAAPANLRIHAFNEKCKTSSQLDVCLLLGRSKKELAEWKEELLQGAAV